METYTESILKLLLCLSLMQLCSHRIAYVTLAIAYGATGPISLHVTMHNFYDMPPSYPPNKLLLCIALTEPGVCCHPAQVRAGVCAVQAQGRRTCEDQQQQQQQRWPAKWHAGKAGGCKMSTAVCELLVQVRLPCCSASQVACWGGR
jgi:hypothetical protein